MHQHLFYKCFCYHKKWFRYKIHFAFLNCFWLPLEFLREWKRHFMQRSKPSILASLSLYLQLSYYWSSNTQNLWLIKIISLTFYVVKDKMHMPCGMGFMHFEVCLSTKLFLCGWVLTTSFWSRFVQQQNQTSTIVYDFGENPKRCRRHKLCVVKRERLYMLCICVCMFAWLLCPSLSYGIITYCPLYLVKHTKLASVWADALYKSHYCFKCV